jgi:hypothetical protein
VPRPVGHPDNSALGKLGNYVRWAAEPDRVAATAPARAAFNDRFLSEARALFGNDLPPDELAYRAEHLRRAHFARLALRSAQVRRAKAAAKRKAAS